MDEENSPKGNDGKVSRRDLLRMAGILGAAAATGQLTTGCTSEDEIPPKTSALKTNSQQSTNPQPKPVEQQPIAASGESLFSNCTANEKVEAQKRINEQILHYQINPDLSGRINQSKRWDNMIRDCANKLGYKPNSFVISYLSSLIFVESEGDPKAISAGVGARGLCQLKWDTAQQAYGKVTGAERKNIGISLSKPDDLFDSKTNITLSLQILAYYHECFPDPSLTFWVYHLGEGNLIHAIRAYLTSNNLMNNNELDKVLGDTAKKGTKALVEKYQLNYIKLITNPAVIQQLKKDEAYQDDTQYYVPRIGAAKYFLSK